MSTEFFNDQWRIPSDENQNKISNYSMEFDGTNDFVTISNPTELTDDFTIAAWIYPTRVNDSYEMIYTQGTTFSSVPPYFAVKDTRLHVYLTGTYETGLNFITADEWQHVALTRTSGVLNLYRNGVEYIGARPIQNGTINNNSAGIIGKWNSNTHYFQGKIDQFCIFDYALPETGTNSVATLYGGGTAVTNPMSLSPKPIYFAQLGDQSVSTGANYLVPNNSLSDYVFNFINPSDGINVASSNVFNFGTGDFTISMWFKINSFPGFPYLFDFRPTSSSSTDAPGVYISSSNQVLLFGGGTIISSSSGKILATNIWYNFVVKRTGNTFTIHYDGGSADRTGTSTVDFNTDLEVHIGSKYDNANGFDGEISNFQVFNTALPQTGSNSIETIYNNGSPLTSMSGFTSLISWWKLNAADTFDGTNWTINDYAGSNDGTSSGMDSSSLIVSTLQQTSGFSPYALDFSGITAHLKTYTTPAATNTVTLSAWVKRTGASGSYAGVFGLRNSGGSPNFGICWDLCFLSTTNKIEFRVSETDGSAYIQSTSNVALTDNTWTHVAGVADGTNIKLYINGVLQTDVESYNGTLRAPTSNILFAAQGPAGSSPFNGQLSNCARWNIGLTQAQVTEIFNSGRPSNLNNFSGTAPIGWWQLGSNSSFEGDDWTCLDEIGTDYADSNSTTMSNDDIVDGPGYSASGLGSSSIDIVGDAPYSTANGLSENQDVLARVKDTPPT